MISKSLRQMGPVRIRRRQSYAAAQRDLSRLLGGGERLVESRDALVGILAEGLQQTTISGTLLGLIVEAPHPISTRLLSTQCGSRVNVTQELAKRLMHPAYPLVLRRSFARPSGGREFRYIPTELGREVWQRLAPDRKTLMATQVIRARRGGAGRASGFSPTQACHPQTWRMALVHYQRLRADTVSWPFNEQTAARMLREALPKSPRLWSIMKALAQSGHPLTTEDLYTTYRLYRRYGRQSALGHIGTAIIALLDMDPPLVTRLYQQHQFRYVLSEVGQQVMANDITGLQSRQPPERPLLMPHPPSPRPVPRQKPIEETMPAPRRKPVAEIKTRACLKCDRLFRSTGAGHRLCHRCQ